MAGNRDKVVSIAGANSGTVLLRRLCSFALTLLMPRLEQHFTACEKFFVELSSAATSDQDQQRFLDFMRQLKHHRSEILKGFGVSVSAAFAQLEQRVPAAERAGERTADSLELISQEQIEKQLTLSRMVSRARGASQKALFQLQERMLVIAAHEFSEHDNPLDPGQIASMFLQACEPVEMDNSILKLFCNQFDVHVLQQLDDFYRKSNELLIEAHILPDLSTLASRPARVPEPPSAGTRSIDPWQEDAQETDEAQEERTLNEIASLLQQLRGGLSSLPASAQAAAPAASVDRVAPVSSGQLMSVIADLQAQSTWLGGGPKESMNIRGVIDAISANRGGVSLGRADEDVVSILIMFFDTILEDRDLPTEIQALISRLQLPVLGLALKDRAFFTDRNHPARQFINAIARAGLGWETSTTDTQDSQLELLSQLVTELLANPEGNADSYAEALARLQEQSEKIEQRAVKIERRTNEKAIAEARTAAARDAVHQVLQQRLDDRDLPAPILEFFINDWQRVLQIFYLRKGTESPEWIDAVRMIDDLVRYASMPANEAARVELERLLPDLYQRLESVLGHTQSFSSEAHTRVDAIRQLHQRLSQPAAAGMPEAEPVATVEKVRIAPPPLLPPRNPRPPIASAEPEAEPPSAALKFESLVRADEIALGTWLEYEDSKSGSTRRCRLSSRIDETRMCLFSDRNGMLILEKPRKSFAYELQLGKFRVIEDAPLVERTMERLTANLRQRATEG